jgi:hypothetical protein
MDQIDRYVLGLAVLEGDRDARKILADLLEEQGDRGLAQWARRCQNRSHRRLDLAIMLLPCRIAVRLGAIFAQAAKFECEGEMLSNCSSMANTVAEWYLESINNDDVLIHCSRAANQGPKNVYALFQTASNRSIAAIQASESVAEVLLGAVEFAIQSIQVQQIEPRQVLHWEGIAKNYIRDVATLTKDWINFSTGMPGDHRLRAVAWQIEETRSALNYLISPDEFPWPK